MMIRRTSNPTRRMAREPSAQADKPEESAASNPSLSKHAQLVALLTRPGGATLDDLIAATGWLSHTTRAALTGLRKKGHVIARDKVDGVSRYTITSPTPATTPRRGTAKKGGR